MNYRPLHFDARQVPPSVAFEPIPEGWYKAIITKSNVKPTRDGQGAMLALTLEIIEGQYKGRNVFWNLNIWHGSSQQTIEIAYRQLSAIGHVVGTYDIQSQEAPDHVVPMLHNKPFFVHVTVTAGEQGPMNNCRGVKDINGNPPGASQQQGGGAPQGFPQQQGGATPFGGPAGGGFAGPAGGFQPGGFDPNQQQQQQGGFQTAAPAGSGGGGWTTGPATGPGPTQGGATPFGGPANQQPAGGAPWSAGPAAQGGAPVPGGGGAPWAR